MLVKLTRVCFGGRGQPFAVDLNRIIYMLQSDVTVLVISDCGWFHGSKKYFVTESIDEILEKGSQCCARQARLRS